MDFADTVRRVFSERFAALPTSARRTAVAVAIAVFFCAAYLMGGDSGGPDTFLMNEAIPMSQLPAMEAALAQEGLNEYTVEEGRIKVPLAEKNRYMAALAQANVLPSDFGEILDEAIGPGSMWDSREQKMQRIKNARQRELARIITSMPGVDKAMVLYDEAESGGIGRKKVLTASVSIKPSGTNSLPLKQVRAARNLVAAAIAGLEPTSVSVTDLNPGRSYPPDEELPLAEIYGEEKRTFEHRWRQKIRESLAWVPGIDVNVDLTLEEANAAGQTAGNAQWWPVSARITLSVPRSYIESVWRKRYRIPNTSNTPLPPAGELEDLETELTEDVRGHVARLISPQANSELDVELTVFDDIQATQSAATTASGIHADWKSPVAPVAGIGVLALVGLLTLRWFHRPQPALDETASDPVPEMLAFPEPVSPDAVTTVGEDTTPPETSPSAPFLPEQEVAPESTANLPLDRPPTNSISNRLVPGPMVDGIELNDMTSQNMGWGPGEGPAAQSSDTESDARPFNFLQEATADELAQFLSRENAQVIAVVFSHLEPSLAAKVLDQLPAALQVDVVQRLRNLDDMNEDVVREIEEGLEAWFVERLQKTKRRNAGQEAVKKILDAAERQTRQAILGGAPRESTEDTGSQTLQPELKLTGECFAEVLQLNNAELRKVLRAANPQDVILALAGTESDVIDRVIRSMRPREADRLRQALQDLNPTQLAQVEKCQQKIARLAAQLHDQGRISLTPADQLATSA